MLSDRRQQILCALIEEYVAHAMPVGSKTLTDGYGLGVSSATIRNELSLLEEEGYIRQPHTSAGRVPTERGYRAFVDHLVETKGLDEQSALSEEVREIKAQARELDEMVERLSSALTRFTDCMSLVLDQTRTQTGVRQMLGIGALIAQPEFSEAARILPVIRVLEDRMVMLEIADDVLRCEEDPAVRIGAENVAEGLHGVSVVASPFGQGAHMGIVAVIGPTRMDYSRAMAAVRAASASLQDM